MSKKLLFNIYSNNLHFLKEHGYLINIQLKFERTFICPICLRQFSEGDLDSKSLNMLTIEHAPPESLGGSGGTMTCKECNSVAGTEIDAYLVGRLRELDSRGFLPNTETRARVTSGDITVQGKITVDKDGIMTMTHDAKHNHPVKLANFIDRVGPDSNPIIHIEFANKNNKISFHRWQIGLLKTAYLLLFKKFGYAFILDKVYDPIRQQIHNPDIKIYPDKFWIGQDVLLKEYEGVNQCTTSSAEGIYCIFSLKTAVSSLRYRIHLPIPMLPASIMIGNIHKMLVKSNIEFSFYKDNPNVDYLFNIKNIDSIRNWFYRVRLSKIGINDRINIPTAINYLINPLTGWEYSYYNYPPQEVKIWPKRLRLAKRSI